MPACGTMTDPNYFRFPKPIEGTIIACLMVLFGFTLYAPNSPVLDYVGPVGTFVRYMNKNHLYLLRQILYVSILVHAGEAVYAAYLCRRKRLNMVATTKWFIQTLIMGFPSLMVLVAYKGQRKTK